MRYLIDTHCHLDSECYDNDLEQVLNQAHKHGVKKIVIPGANPKDLPRAVQIVQNYSDVYFAVGIHPCDLENGVLDEISHYASHPKCVAVGECGLDYYRLPPQEEIQRYKSEQKEIFIAQIELALQYALPLIVHIREASDDVFEILKAYPRLQGVLHCFNADEVLLGLSDNFYYGIGGVATFKNAKKLVDILPKIPKNRILFETDSPYLAPHPYRGKRNEPSYVPLIVEKISEVLAISVNEITSISTQNALSLFKRIEIE